jgi:hypothetical protein
MEIVYNILACKIDFTFFFGVYDKDWCNELLIWTIGVLYYFFAGSSIFKIDIPEKQCIFCRKFRSGGHYRVHTQRPPVESFHGISQSLLINVAVVLQIMRRRPTCRSSQFIVHCSSLAWTDLLLALLNSTINEGTILDWVSSQCSDSLRVGLPGDRIPIGGPDFQHPFWPTLGPTQPPVQWVPGFSAGVKAAGAWRWPPTPPSSAEVKESVDLYLHSLSET